MGLLAGLKAKEQSTTTPQPEPTPAPRSDWAGPIAEATKQATNLAGLGVARTAIVDAIKQRFVGLTPEQVEALVPAAAQVNPEPAPKVAPAVTEAPKEEPAAPPAKPAKAPKGKVAGEPVGSDYEAVRALALAQITEHLKQAQGTPELCGLVEALASLK